MPASKPLISRSERYLHYLVLAGILIIGVTGYWLSQYHVSQQKLFIVLTGVSYVMWGIWHHYRYRDLYWEVVLEYILIALLAVVLLLGIV